MRFDRKAKLIALGAMVTAVAALVYGFSLDAEGFAGNALAELAGMLLSVLLAVLVVDGVLEAARRRRWAIVSSETVDALRFAMVRGGLSIYLRIDPPRAAASDPYMASMMSPEALALAFARLADEIRGMSGAAFVAKGPLIPPEVEEELRLIRDGVMPRLLSLGEAELVAAVAVVDARLHDLIHAAWLEQRFGGEHVTDAIANLCDAMGKAVTATTTATR